MMLKKWLFRWTAVVLLALPSAHAADAPRPLLVFAAASLTNALDELGAAYTAQSTQEVKFSYAASSGRPRR